MGVRDRLHRVGSSESLQGDDDPTNWWTFEIEEDQVFGEKDTYFEITVRAQANSLAELADEVYRASGEIQ